MRRIAIYHVRNKYAKAYAVTNDPPSVLREPAGCSGGYVTQSRDEVDNTSSVWGGVSELTVDAITSIPLRFNLTPHFLPIHHVHLEPHPIIDKPLSQAHMAIYNLALHQISRRFRCDRCDR